RHTDRVVCCVESLAPARSSWAPVPCHWSRKGHPMAEFTFATLSPSAFLDRSAAVFADRTAVIDGGLRLSYAQLADRCARVVSALAAAGVGAGDGVAALGTNSHVMLGLPPAAPGA